MSKKLHPSIQKFKDFVKVNPHIKQEVRSGKATWQELFEEWYLLGEDDPRWAASTEKNIDANEAVEKKSDWMSQVMGLVKNMDPNQVQNHLANLSQAIGAVQGLVSQFQGSKPTTETRKPEGPPNPFSFRKD